MTFRVNLRLTLLGAAVLLAAAACQSAPQTEYLLEVTREVTREVTVMVVVTASPDNGAVSASPSVTPSPPETVTTAAPASTPTVDPFPTPTVNQVIVAEQVFENGRMFYLQPTQEIWVMVNTGDATTGTYSRFPDTWREGMPESDPDIEPPEGMYQPLRGFGKLWRENEEVRDALGWALDPEHGRVATYQYFPGGEVVNGVYSPGPGYHTVDSYYGGTFVFNESDSTWGVLAASTN